MKILFKIINAGSGADVYFHLLANWLRERGIDVEIRYFHKIFQYFPFLISFFHNNEKSVIVHSSVEYGWVFKKPNTKLVTSLFHNVFESSYFKQTSILQRIYYILFLKYNIKRTLKASDANIAISKYTKHSFNKTFKMTSSEQIYPVIDLSKYKRTKRIKKVNEKRFTLLFVGNLIKRKGVDLLPKIMKLLGKNYVLYYTSGLSTRPPNNFDLSNMISLGRLPEEELIKKYNECDALLAPSRLEGFGYQIVEAMVCGKPVITTNCSSLPELIINHKGGFLCEVNNVNDFVERIEILAKDEKLRKSMGRFNRRRILKKFNLEKVGKEYQKLYNKILHK